MVTHGRRPGGTPARWTSGEVGVAPTWEVERAGPGRVLRRQTRSSSLSTWNPGSDVANWETSEGCNDFSSVSIVFLPGRLFLKAKTFQNCLDA